MIESLKGSEAEVAELQSTLEKSTAETESLRQQMDKRADDHSHVLQETSDILQRTSDENEALNRALVSLIKPESVSVRHSTNVSS